jgi:hypothetical protein
MISNYRTIIMAHRFLPKGEYYHRILHTKSTRKLRIEFLELLFTYKGILSRLCWISITVNYCSIFSL